MTRDDKVTAACVIAVIVFTMAALAWPLYPFPSLPAGKNWLDGMQAIAETVSAFSTTAAIIVGAVVVYWQVGRQHAKDAERALAEEVRRLKIMASGVFHCRALCQQMLDQNNIGGPIWEQHGALERQSELLSKIPLLDFPDWDAAYAVSDVALITSKLGEQIAERPGLDIPANTQRRREEHLNVAENNFRAAETILRYLLNARGTDVPPERVSHNGIAYCSAPLEDRQREADTAVLLTQLKAI
jgi:hypothetical protein